MIITLSWLKDHLITNANLEKIIDKLTSIGLEVEGIKDSQNELSNFKIGYLKIEPTFYTKFMKIVFSTSIMSYVFHKNLNFFAKNLSYSSDYKILYLLFIVIFVALLYFLICYFLKVLNLRSFRTN